MFLTYFFLKDFITGTPISFKAAALHCCSYCPFMGMTNNFFFMKRASAGVSKPAPQRMPLLVAILVTKASLVMGCTVMFLFVNVFLLCFEKTSQVTSLIFDRMFNIFSSS